MTEKQRTVGPPSGQWDNTKRIHVVQGEFCVTDDPDVLLLTLLGSCVAACLHDPVARVGGMNHFLLPGDAGGLVEDVQRHGVHAMELLVNGLLKRGARRENLEAKLFGGAKMIHGLVDVGARNSLFAEHFLERERITYTGGSLRGERGRRVQFWPVSGRARQMLIQRGSTDLVALERQVRSTPTTGTGAVEFF